MTNIWSADTSMWSMGNYEVLREIGRGNMGTVYLARNSLMVREVALKVAHKHPAGEDRKSALYQSLFFNEMRAAGMLRHPNIVEVFDAGKEGNDYYIAMEYVPGGETLEKFCRGPRLAPLELVVDAVLKCAEALDYAHRKGIIHRDIKPGNILVGSHGEIKLSDFSVALLTDPGIADTQLMETVGSPLYMSPEQISEESITNQSDLFSLGVMLYEMLTGQHPFAAHTLAGLTHRIVNEQPPPVGHFRADVPESLSGIVERAIAKSPAERYASALELAADLSRIFGDLRRPLDGITTEGRVDRLKGLSFFEEFPIAEIWELLRWADWADYARDESIIKEGEAGDTFYIVVSGTVRVHKEGQEVARLGAGECFGEMAYLASRPRSASVQAIDSVSVLKLNAESVHGASVRCQAEFQRVFIRTLIERLVHTTERLVT